MRYHYPSTRMAKIKDWPPNMAKYEETETLLTAGENIKWCDYLVKPFSSFFKS